MTAHLISHHDATRLLKQLGHFWFPLRNIGLPHLDIFPDGGFLELHVYPDRSTFSPSRSFSRLAISCVMTPGFFCDPLLVMHASVAIPLNLFRTSTRTAADILTIINM